MNKISPKKLLMSKWTAVQVQAKQKHFLVSKIILPDDQTSPVTEVEIEAVYSGVKRIIAWRELEDDALWKQGWV
jgi:tryptophan-rich hypothetical protein